LEAVLMGRRVTERDAIERWFADQRPRMIRTAYSILRDRQEAEDVVQQTLLAVWDRSQRAQVRNPGGYLARAVYWNALKRRARRRIEISLDALPEPRDGFTSPFPADRIDPFELELAIEQLPPAQQAVIRLRFYLGLTFREIGANLSISTNTAASRTRYALANLRKAIGPPPKHKESHND
jgi:RNA polymerase sigma-70 factor (ECF subfamily)